jgi:hypothetical protein
MVRRRGGGGHHGVSTSSCFYMFKPAEREPVILLSMMMMRRLQKWHYVRRSSSCRLFLCADDTCWWGMHLYLFNFFLLLLWCWSYYTDANLQLRPGIIGLLVLHTRERSVTVFHYLLLRLRSVVLFPVWANNFICIVRTLINILLMPHNLKARSSTELWWRDLMRITSRDVQLNISRYTT